MSETYNLADEKLVEVYSTQNDIEANLIKGLLEAYNIDCVLVSAVPHAVYPFTVNGLGEVKIKVLESAAEQAQQIIEDYQQSIAEMDARDASSSPVDRS